MHKILIVEDDTKLRNELKIFLSNNDYQVLTIDTFEDTIDTILKQECDLILLDVNLPYIDGQVICKTIRKKITTPIIIITSRNSEIDELISINYGADDFITKPFNTQILLARINRLINRTTSVTSIIYKGFTLDISKSIIFTEDNKLELAKNELKILHYLLSNQNRIISHDEIMDYLWNTNEFIDANTLAVNINRLRNKLLELGYSDIIKTKRGQGYIICD